MMISYIQKYIPYQPNHTQKYTTHCSLGQLYKHDLTLISGPLVTPTCVSELVYNRPGHNLSPIQR